jgi:hypothetical protein
VSPSVTRGVALLHPLALNALVAAFLFQQTFDRPHSGRVLLLQRKA